ncbi:MAG: hypothetical protein SGILL_001864 [Bacillariaceae sp.]
MNDTTADFGGGEDPSMMMSFVAENQTVLHNEDLDLVNSFMSVSGNDGTDDDLGVGEEQENRTDNNHPGPTTTRPSTEVLITSILEITAATHPNEYLQKLTDKVLPHLGLNHELLPTLFAWACQLADDYDDQEDGLDKSILLLQSLDDAMKRLRLQQHSSFAHYAPFVDRLITANVKKHSRLDFSRLNDSSASLDASMDRSTQLDKSISFCKDDTDPSEGSTPKPTVLEIANMKKGAKKASKLLQITMRFDTFDEKNEESIELKLDEARLLLRARLLGLPRSRASLREFEYQGGAKYLCTELVRLFSSGAETHEQRQLELTENVQLFCEASKYAYDAALLRYGTELCGGKSKSASPEAIEEATSIARCCESSTTKCQTMLMVLRSALFCHFSPEWLTKTSKEAVEWASGDLSLQAELEEASRLLLIDGIVGKYCGDGAKKLFHVDVPIAATRLFNIVTRSLNRESVLTDIIDLCGAFNHLSVEDGCSRLIDEAIMNGETEMAIDSLKIMYSRNASTAHDIFSRVMTYCIDFLDEVSTQADPYPSDKEQADTISSCALEMTKIALVQARSMVASDLGHGFTACQYTVPRLESLQHDLELMQTLQTDFKISVCLSDLKRPEALVNVATELLSILAEEYKKGQQNSAGIVATNMRRACALLASGSDNGGLNESDLLFVAAQKPAQRLAYSTEGTESIDFLKDLGILAASENKLASLCCLALALSFCLKSSKQSKTTSLETTMKGLVLASSILQDYALSNCSGEILGAATAFASLSDIVSQVLFRADEGYGEDLDQFRKTLTEKAVKERQSFGLAITENSTTSEVERFTSVNQPSFHPTWYVGDGLLLPPQEALDGVLEYCRQSMGLQSGTDPETGIESFASDRYALTLALRTHADSTVRRSCHRRIESANLLDNYADNLKHSLVERYLGGVGNGITSGVVDGELALSHLLSLAPKPALKEYMAALHAAIKMRDYKRVGALATIGTVAGSRVSLLCSKESPLSRYWTRPKMQSQCDQLQNCASWWQALKDLNVKFDPHSFDISNKSSETSGVSKKRSVDSYEVSIIPSMVFALSRNGESLESTLAIVSRFASDFSLPTEIPIQKCIEFLLNPVEYGTVPGDIRGTVSALEGIAGSLLHRLESRSTRFGALRQCLMKYESNECCVDYERLSVVLSLYQNELSSTMTEEMTSAFSREAELVDRRCEALAILSSYYHKEKTEKRPSFSKLFLPLPPSIADHGRSDTQESFVCHVLGWEAKSGDGFDPLKPLEEPLRSSFNSNITSALSLLCIPLGVPMGYIRARSLIAKFQRSTKEGAVLPSLEEVTKVLNVLRDASDRAELSHWCSEQYDLNHPEKMQCLDYSLTAAMKASSEAEQKWRDKDRVAAALARLRSIAIAKDNLSARLGINTVLQTAKDKCDRNRSMLVALEKLCQWLDHHVWHKEDEFVPEDFVEKLLNEASHIASDSVLRGNDAMSVGQFRSFGDVVHRCSDFISETYSHVQIGQIARTLTSRWLFHGDTQNFQKHEGSENNASSTQLHSLSLLDINEDDTMDFTMDLAALRDDALWGSAGTGASTEKRKLAMEEEPSSVNASSLREKSESDCIRCGLRVVFVVSSSLRYYRPFAGDANKPFESSEENTPNYKPSPASSKSKGLLSKSRDAASKEKRNHENVLQHCRELLQIIFAKSLAADHVVTGPQGSSNTVTFAMRHRGLRVAALLLPQEALEEILGERTLSSKTKSISLNDCAFAAFCAKELEEMALPVPNSDLMQLSQMHFQSFARALWRHHRNMEGAKGRLFLLILELYLKDTVSDFAFLRTLMKDIEALRLPRTLLLAFESIERYMNKKGPQVAQGFLDATRSDTLRIVSKLSDMVFTDLKKQAGDVPTAEQPDVVRTLGRLGHILGIFSKVESGQELVVKFCSSLLDEMHKAGNDAVRNEAYNKIVYQALENVESEEIQADIKDRLAEISR